MTITIRNITIIMFLAIFASTGADAARIKDIARIEGSSGVQVIGYGLVSGLNQSGDNQLTTFTVQSVSNMLKRFGITIPNSNPRMRNVAAVMVTATIPSYLKEGSKVDVQVSSIGDATSLQGGVLLMTPLLSSSGEVVGLAQGGLSVGGFDFRSLGSRVGRNFVTTARVPNGLILERDIDAKFVDNQLIKITLLEPDFSTCNRMAAAIRTVAGLANAVTAIDAATVQIQLPAGQTSDQNIQTISQIEILNIATDVAAKVVINERTGTVVVGGNVELLPSVIAHGGLEISIQKNIIVPNQAPFTLAPRNPVETATVIVEEEMNPSTPLEVNQAATVQDIANSLNMLQVKPRDLIAIFQALKESGALQAELVIQ